MKAKCWFIIFLITTMLLFSCQNKPKQPNGCESIPEFEQKFPQKSVWIHHHANDSTEITFSSMEEAEWKLMHVVPNCSFVFFEKKLPSDPSSTNFPFDSLFCDNDKTFCDVLPVNFDDGNLKYFCFQIIQKMDQFVS